MQKGNSLQSTRIGLLAAVAVVAACSAPTPSMVVAPTPATYAAELAQLERGLAQAQARLEATQHNQDAAPAADLFEGWLRHARLSGDINSYLAAQQSLSSWRQRQQRSPCVAAAKWALATHQPRLAATELAACDGSAPLGLLADIAWYTGQYATAVDLAIAALNRDGSAADFSRLAQWRLRLGSPQEAAALMEAAEARYHNDNPHQLAWYKLQRGLIALHSGQFERARALYSASLRALPDWWLAQEHLAEVQLLLGETDAARALYDTVIASTGYAEFLEARAAMDEAAGDANAAAVAVAKAREQLATRLQTLPQAVAGHAVEFYLAHGPVEQALQLAGDDYARRPFGDAAILLAEAHLLKGDPQAVIELLQPHLDAGWSTAEAHHVLARAYATLDQLALSGEHRQRALALNPQIVAMSGPM